MNIVSTRDKVAAIDGDAKFLKIGGAVDFDAALGNLTTTPAAFVMPLAESASPNEFQSQEVMQEVQSLVGVVIAVRDVSDAAGAGAIDVLQKYRLAVIDALLGWPPYVDWQGFEYSGGQLLGFKNGVVFWQDDFVTTYYIRKT